jgi:hypothetical protein
MVAIQEVPYRTAVLVGGEKTNRISISFIFAKHRSIGNLATPLERKKIEQAPR